MRSTTAQTSGSSRRAFSAATTVLAAMTCRRRGSLWKETKMPRQPNAAGNTHCRRRGDLWKETKMLRQPHMAGNIHWCMDAHPRQDDSVRLCEADRTAISVKQVQRSRLLAHATAGVDDMHFFAWLRIRHPVHGYLGLLLALCGGWGSRL